MAHAMSDDQVSTELRKMTAFIRQEATEKAREIEIKADEEFAIEKSKLVRQETSSIDNQFEKRFKQAGMSQQITRSTLSNKTRLKVLGARQELLDDIFERTRGRLGELSKDKGKYEGVCKNLILEGIYALNEPTVAVRAKKGEYDVVKKAIDSAKKEAHEKAGLDVEIVLDEKHAQPDESTSGGVSIVGTNGKVDINNTFDERLKLLEVDALPMVRTTLFGKNENRRFYD